MSVGESDRPRWLPLGRPGYINLGHRADLGRDTDISALETRSHEVMDVARDAGISYFDAARSYGRAEEFLSSWLDSRAIEPGEVTVASKWGYVYTADWRVDAEQHEVKDLSAENLRRAALAHPAPPEQRARALTSSTTRTRRLSSRPWSRIRSRTGRLVPPSPGTEQADRA